MEIVTRFRHKFLELGRDIIDSTHINQDHIICISLAIIPTSATIWASHRMADAIESLIARKIVPRSVAYTPLVLFCLIGLIQSLPKRHPVKTGLADLKNIINCLKIMLTVRLIRPISIHDLQDMNSEAQQILNRNPTDNLQTELAMALIEETEEFMHHVEDRTDADSASISSDDSDLDL